MGESTDLSGVYLVDKPAGPTSHDVLGPIRRRLGRGVKVGHAGTLDPFATGLLVLGVGRATRLLQYVVGHDKTYRARIRLGATSATGDPEGPIVPTGEPLPDESTISVAVGSLTQIREQQTPAYSAVKVDGERLHRRARRGETPETPVRSIVIHSATLLATDPAGTWFDLEMRCSAGTYVRQVAVDLGEMLGCGGYCETLRRTGVGELVVDDAVAPDDIPSRGRIDPRHALAPMPIFPVSVQECADIRHGRPVRGTAGIGHDPVALVDPDGAVVAVAEPDGCGHLRPRVVLI